MSGAIDNFETGESCLPPSPPERPTGSLKHLLRPSTSPSPLKTDLACLTTEVGNRDGQGSPSERGLEERPSPRGQSVQPIKPDSLLPSRSVHINHCALRCELDRAQIRREWLSCLFSQRLHCAALSFSSAFECKEWRDSEAESLLD